MSLSLNSVTMAGNLTRDPEVKTLSGDLMVASLGVALNRRWKGKDGEKREEVTYVEVSAWGRTAELCGQYLRKGSAVYIEGFLKMDAWKTKEGQARQTLKIEAKTVQFLDPADDVAQPVAPVAVKQPIVEDPF